MIDKELRGILEELTFCNHRGLSIVSGRTLSKKEWDKLINKSISKIKALVVQSFNEEELMNIIHKSEICSVANKNSAWFIRKTRKKDLAEAIIAQMKEKWG